MKCGACTTLYSATGTPIGIDATRTIPGEDLIYDWPDELARTEEIETLVERRRKEYGL